MRLTSAIATALLTASSASTAADEVKSGIGQTSPVKAVALRLDGPIQGTLGPSDNRSSFGFYDCFTLTAPANMSGPDLYLESAGKDDLIVAFVPGHECVVESEEDLGILPPKKIGRESFYDEMSLLIGSEKPIAYSLMALAKARGETSCLRRRGTRAIVSGEVLFTTVNGKPDLVPVVEHEKKWVRLTAADYPVARDLNWFKKNEKIMVRGTEYTKWGLPRVYGPTELEYFGEKDGVMIAKENGVADEDVQVVYAQLDQPGCEFQPYHVPKTKKD